MKEQFLSALKNGRAKRGQNADSLIKAFNLAYKKATRAGNKISEVERCTYFRNRIKEFDSEHTSQFHQFVLNSIRIKNWFELKRDLKDYESLQGKKKRKADALEEVGNTPLNSQLQQANSLPGQRSLDEMKNKISHIARKWCISKATKNIWGPV